MENRATCNLKEKARERVVDIDDKRCALFQFSNQNDQIKIGYQAWIKPKNLKQVEELIKEQTEIEIYWPINLNIVPTKTMRKVLNTAQFCKEVVTIKSVGGRSTILYF